jgi:hypothetical protein
MDGEEDAGPDAEARPQGPNTPYTPNATISVYDSTSDAESTWTSQSEDYEEGPYRPRSFPDSSIGYEGGNMLQAVDPSAGVRPLTPRPLSPLRASTPPRYRCIRRAMITPRGQEAGHCAQERRRRPATGQPGHARSSSALHDGASAIRPRHGHNARNDAGARNRPSNGPEAGDAAQPDTHREHSGSVFAFDRLPTTRDAAREAAESGPAFDPSTLAQIQENESGPCCSTELMKAVLAHYNSLHCINGPVETLHKQCMMDLAFADVPNSSIMSTSNPLTAALSRWQFCTLFLLMAAAVFSVCASDLRGASAAIESMKWIKVDNIHVYENVFPDMQLGANAPANRPLVLEDCGLFVYSHNFKLIEGCTSVISKSSFEILCDHPVLAHGVWVLVSGATNRGGAHELPMYGYAGLEYSYTLASEAPVTPDKTVATETDKPRLPTGAQIKRRPDSEDDVSHVLGTGQVTPSPLNPYTLHPTPYTFTPKSLHPTPYR